MLRQIWLVQPLAFARGGSSPTPCDAFDWSAPDLNPHGSGRTQVVPADTLIVDPESGEVTLKPGSSMSEVVFKDGDHIRPVCPFFELHGAWETDAGLVEGPVTPAVLAASGKTAADLKWQISFHNAKAAHWTRQDSDRVFAEVDIDGDHCQPVELKGISKAGKFPGLVPAGKHIPLGSVQLTRPNAEFPEFRLRFHPGSGAAWGPRTINDRIAALKWPGHGMGSSKPFDMVPFVWTMIGLNQQWEGFALPEAQAILDPDAAWPNYKLFTEADVGPAMLGAIDDLVTVAELAGDPSQLLRYLLGGQSDAKDVRNLPPGLYARVTEEPNLFASLGMVDDFGDGTIACTIGGVGTATARIVSGPPDFAPDRRPPVSLADGLADRLLRSEVRDPAWVGGDNAEVSDLEIAELIARAFETMGLANIDATNDYFQEENRHHAVRDKGAAVDLARTAEQLWTPRTPLEEDARARLFLANDPDWGEPLPLTALGRDAHRRNTASIFFRALTLRYPDFVERWIREPAGPDRYYDRKMPGLMRGGDRMPLTLTRRQYDMLAAWVDSLKAPPQGPA